MSNGGAVIANTMTQQPQSQITAVQSNGGPKKVISGGGSSGGPTPAATPIQNGTGQGPSPPPLTNAPKYGTLVPNRIFVGGISANTTETELMQLFSEFGTVKAAKIIQDRAGVSKGYGFITFESEDDARRPLRNADNIMLRERRLNIAPAIKKQPFGRPSTGQPYDTHIPNDGRSPAPPSHQAAMQPPMPPIFFGAAPPFYAGATAYYAPPVPSMVSSAQAPVQVSQANQDQPTQQATVYQAPPVYPTQTGPPQTAPYASMMFPQTIYMPQQYSVVPYDYPYGVGAGPTPSNGIPAHFANAGTPSGGGASPPRGPCYAPGPAPQEATILYGPAPPHPLFHPAAMDPTGAGGPLYATADGAFDPMGHATIAHFGSMGMPYGMNEDGSFLDRPGGSATPRSVLTATPPSEQRSTATPVVSVLALEQQQEKDPAAMQGGRRPSAQIQPQRRGPAPTGNRRPYGRPPNVQLNSQPPPATSFIPPVRRPRKPQRRTTTPHGVTNEIGAGDAPLPNQDDSLVTQVEALKI
ncbi:extensin-like isoform X2 [Sitophilus oryzae]|nr:extensin-like isoform X2 [Sitophilus oryzae]XP_030747365.1 extensin-like isoform X2 [Sitophilus oryzae]